MSDDSGRKVHDAIAEAVRDANPGSIVTGYVLIIEATDGSDMTSFVYDAAEGQHVSTSLGLLDIGRRFHLGRIGDGQSD